MRLQEINKMAASRLDKDLPRKGIIGGHGIPDRPKYTTGGGSVFFGNLTPEQQLLLSRTLMALVVLGGVGSMAHALLNPSPVLANGLESGSSDKSPLTGKPILHQADSHQKISEKPSLVIGSGSRASGGLASGGWNSSVRSEIAVASAINNKGIPATATGKSGKEQTGGGGQTWAWSGFKPTNEYWVVPGGNRGCEQVYYTQVPEQRDSWVPLGRGCTRMGVVGYDSVKKYAIVSFPMPNTDPNPSRRGAVQVVRLETGWIWEAGIAPSGPKYEVEPANGACAKVYMSPSPQDRSTWAYLGDSCRKMGVLGYSLTDGYAIVSIPMKDRGNEVQVVNLSPQPPGYTDYLYGTTYFSEYGVLLRGIDGAETRIPLPIIMAGGSMLAGNMIRIGDNFHVQDPYGNYRIIPHNVDGAYDVLTQVAQEHIDYHGTNCPQTAHNYAVANIQKMLDETDYFSVDGYRTVVPKFRAVLGPDIVDGDGCGGMDSDNELE